MSSRAVSQTPSAGGSRASERDRPLHELLSRDLVDIYVGPDNTHWILHEKLLCHRSRFFRDIFHPDNKKRGPSKPSAHTLPDEEDAAFHYFVGWLYAARLPAVREERELRPLFDLYLMAEKWEIRALVLDVLEEVRRWYHDSDSWPGLRRVQYIYANTAPESAMRQLLVSCVARMLVTGGSGGGSGGGAMAGMPAHWEKALRRNGPLATDIILCVQRWRIEPDSVPDEREGSVLEIVDEAEERTQIKLEEEADDDAGVNGNGVGQHSSEEEEEEEEEEQEEDNEEAADGEEDENAKPNTS